MLVCDGETCGRIKRFTPEKARLPVPPHILYSHLLRVCMPNRLCGFLLEARRTGKADAIAITLKTWKK